MNTEAFSGQRRITRRTLLARTALGSGALWLAACTAIGQQRGRGAENNTPGTGSPPASAAPKQGGTLRISQSGDIQPAGAPFVVNTLNNLLYELLYDTLVTYNTQLNPRPRLATSWEWSPDFLQVTLRLRPGVKFHTGRPFTSADAKFNLERLRDPAVNSQWLNYARPLQIDAPDPGTLVIKYDTPAKSSFDVLSATFVADPQTLLCNRPPDWWSKDRTGCHSLAEPPHLNLTQFFAIRRKCPNEA